jgi:hypothetical protein
MVNERRKRTRVLVGFDINILLHNKKIKVKTLNISLTGISCTSDPRFKTNELCEVILSLNPETNLIMEGKILRVDDAETTIAFLSMDENSFFHLKRVLQYNAEDPDKIEKELKNPAFI